MVNLVLVGRPAKGGKNGNEYGYFFTVSVYGSTSCIYMYLKMNHIKDYVEKIAIYFGTNMTLLFTSISFFGKIVEDGIWYLNTEFLIKRLTCHTL